MNEVPKPIPLVTPEMRPFFDGAIRGELWIQCCADCGTYRFPAREWCSHCLSRAAKWERASGRGEIFAFTVMHQVYHPAFAAEAPYAVVIVKLAEGPKLTTNVVGMAAHELRIGTAVEVVFESFGPEVSLPKFRCLRSAATA